MNQKGFTNIILVVIIVILIGAVGYFVLVKKSEPIAQQPTSTPTTNPPKTLTSTTPAPTSETVNWQKFNSTLVNLSFYYPVNSNYQEKNVFADRQIAYTGKDIYFSDINKNSPAFEAITNDFTVTDSIPHDIVQGNFSSENSFKVLVFNDKYTKTVKKSAGIYQVTGYGNMECSPFVQSYLVVAPPSASNLKYVVFYLGGASDFSQNELQPQDPCSPKDSAITDKINSIANGQVASINKNLDLAVKIAKTFNSGN